MQGFFSEGNVRKSAETFGNKYNDANGLNFSQFGERAAVNCEDSVK